CRRIESAISDFLWRQEESARAVFIRRYWYFDSIDDICRRTGYSGSKVTSILFRMRRKLRAYLKDEGVEL
ncbi:MAG: sigma-70 family RNA polymerase sigma factor, partial [Anaerovoracaceae bacterium]